MTFTTIATATGQLANAATSSITVPTGVTSSHLGVLVCATAQNPTSSTEYAITGWTKQTDNPTVANNMNFQVLTNLGGSTAGSTLTVNRSGSAFSGAYWAVWYDTGGQDVTIVGTPSGRGGTSVSTVAINGITTTATNQSVIVISSERTTATGTVISSWSPSAPTQDLFLEDTTGTVVSAFIGHFTQATAGATGTYTSTYNSASGNGVGMMLAPGAVVTAFSGSVGLSGSGTLADTGGMGQTAPEALSGSGTLTLSSNAMTVTGPLLLADDGSLSTTGTASAKGSVALAGAGTFTNTGSTAQVATGSVGLSGSGTFTDTNNGVTTSGSDGLTGSGTLTTAISRMTASGSWSQTGVGTDVVLAQTVSASGSDITQTGSGSVSFGTSALAITGPLATSGSSSLSLTGAKGAFKYIASVSFTPTGASASYTVTVPAGVTTSHFGVLTIATGTNGADTFTATGWTPQVVHPTGENNSEVAIYTRLGGLAAGNTFTFSLNTSRMVSYQVVWYDTQGYDVATLGATGTRGGTSSVYTTVPGLSTTALSQPVILVLTDRSTATGTSITGFTGGSGIQPVSDAYVEDTTTNTSVSLWTGSVVMPNPTTIATLTVQYTTASGNATGTMLTIASPNNFGSAATSGSGTLTASGSVVSGVPFSGSGGLFLDTPRRTGSIALSGGSTLVAVKATAAPVYQYDGTHWVAVQVLRYDGNGWIQTAVIAY